MIEVPDDKTITGLTRSELIAMVYALKKERDDRVQEATDACVEQDKLIHELKEIRVRVETVSARLHALINGAK